MKVEYNGTFFRVEELYVGESFRGLMADENATENLLNPVFMTRITDDTELKLLCVLLPVRRALMRLVCSALNKHGRRNVCGFYIEMLFSHVLTRRL